MPRNPFKRHCSQPDYRAWAIRDSVPPLCSAHTASALASPEPRDRHDLVQGFYATVLDAQQIADLTTYALDTTLDAEIAITRLALRRVLGILLTGVTPGPNPDPLTARDVARFAALALQAAGTISRLLHTRQTLPGARDAQMITFLDSVLDELGNEWGIEL
jgi:hypothetical protein